MFPRHGVVLERRHGDEMCGVNALGDPALMVKMHSIWNGSSLSFEDHSMGHTVGTPNVDTGVSAGLPIALTSKSSSPVVAWSFVSHVSRFPVVQPVQRAELPVDVYGSELSWLPATAEAECCLVHKNNTITTMSPKEERAWQ